MMHAVASYKIKYVAVCITEGYLAFGENTHTLSRCDSVTLGL